MVTPNDVRAAAERIRAREAPPGGVKARVSVRTVRRELGRGSFGDIARELDTWRRAANYDPVVERANLPEAFGNRLTTLGKELLEMARSEAARERLAEFTAAEEARAQGRDILDEALDRVDALEAEVAALRTEVGRLRAAPGTAGAATPPGPAGPAVEGPRNPGAEAMRGMVDALRGKSLARDADEFWVAVRTAVEAAMGRRGSVSAHDLHDALPTALKERGKRIGLPLTTPLLRYHLLREAAAGKGIVEAGGGRFALAGPPVPAPAPAPEPDPVVPPAMSGRKFWILFLATVHDVLTANKEAMSAGDIIAAMPPGWVEATRRYGTADADRPVRPGELRYKLRERIERFERDRYPGEALPLVELPDGRFEATGPWPGRGSERPDEAA
ncbi:DNA-binding protein [Methylobacterium pseudosasicola]|uniref:Replication region DNA-binding N-term n=1 Tax=Methylobacterium pseudosasicola TaxID=582667 RepID=A0A1I4PTX7_9HYPH|nr:DNA-binding protein [Methylobacterium pseudosasicola]SFM31217.1 replication region DNA-binding N-term [Methylobacterium pseudosasicola]